MNAIPTTQPLHFGQQAGPGERFPSRGAPAFGGLQALEHVGPVPGAGRILLVDDDQDVRASMCRALTQAGHHVVEAGCGESAAALIGEAGPFDVLVTDVRMPGPCDGVALAACWREKVPGRPVLFVSGYADDWLDMNTLGPHEAMLPKPFRRASLLDAVRLLLA